MVDVATPPAAAPKPARTAIDPGPSWDCLIQVPLVKREYLDDIVRQEADKLYPPDIGPDLPVFWTVLGQNRAEGSAGLVVLVSIPVGRGAGLPLAQAALRYALKTGAGDWQLVVCGGEQCLGLTWRGGVAESRFFAVGAIGANLSAEAARVFVCPAPERLASAAEAVAAWPKAAVVDLWPVAARLPGGAGHWAGAPGSGRKAVALPAAVCLALALLLAARGLADQDRALAAQSRQIAELERVLGDAQKTRDEIRALEAELSAVPLPASLGLRGLLEDAGREFRPGDRSLGFRYDAQAKTFAMACVSADPIGLLKRLSASPRFASVAGGGMVPDEGGGGQKFEWSGTVRQ